MTHVPEKLKAKQKTLKKGQTTPATHQTIPKVTGVTEISPKKTTSQSTGTLYIVATPIGNLGDLGVRACTVLRDLVTTIACEDTRTSRVLLQHYAINTPTISLHHHNESARSQQIIDTLQLGQSVALICDAGTPLISDPGYRLVQKAHLAGLTVSPIPGACAAIAALSASGLCPDHFTFVGFLASKGSRRKKQLQAWLEYPTTLIFYEAPHRMLDFMQSCIELDTLGRRYCIAREISKRFETISQGSPQALLTRMQQDQQQLKGEFVVIAESPNKNSDREHEPIPQPHQAAALSGDPEQILTHLLKYVPKREAISLCCDLTGDKKNKIYKLALKLSENDS